MDRDEAPMGSAATAKDVRARVLVVDDEPLNRTLVRRVLAPHHEIFEAEDGESALRAAAEHRPDVVLLDVMLPDVSGYEVCARLKQAAGDAFLPVVLFSAADDARGRDQGLAAGADDFIGKPFDRRELIARVRLLSRLRAQDAEIRSLRAKAAAREQENVELMSTSAHEVRNPLAALLGLLGALSDEGRAAAPEDLRTALELATRLQQTIDDAIRLRMFSAGKLVLANEPVDVSALLRSVVAASQARAAERAVSLGCIAPEGLVATLDEPLVRRALEHLIGHAIRRSPRGGQVAIEARAAGDCVQVDIADAGSPLPAARRNAIFAAGAAPDDDAQDARAALGLGSWFVRAACSVSGGVASVEELPTGCTAFRLVFPRSAA